MSDLGSMIVSYNADVSGLSSGSNQAVSAVTAVSDAANQSSGGILSAFQSAGAGVLSFVSNAASAVMSVQTLAGTAVNLASAFLQPAATAETTELSFTTLLHSTKAAHQEMEDLNTFAASTPMQTQWVDNAAAKILAFGGKVGDVKPEITAIGDSLSGLGKLSETSLNSIVDIFGKISAQGKITGGDMMQLSTWGIPAWQALSDSMHKPIPELQKMVSAGLIPAKDALPALEQGMEKTFGGGMAKQANTFTGLISTLQSNWQIMMAAIGGPALKLAEQGLTGIGNALSSPAFQSFATGVGQQIAGIFSQIGTFVSNNVVPAFQHLQPVVKQFGDYFAGDQFAGIVADFQTVGNQVLRIAGAFSQASGPVNGLVNGALSSLPGLLSGIFQAADNVMFPLGQFLMWMQQAGPWQDVVKDGLIGIGVAIAAIKIGQFVSTIPSLISGLAAWAAAELPVMIETLATAAPFLLVGAIIAVVVGAIILVIQHWGQISAWLHNAWQVATSAIGNFFSGLGTKLHEIVTGIGNFFHSAWDNIVNGMKIAGIAIFIALTGPIGLLVIYIFTHINQVKSFFSGLVDHVRQIAGQIGNAFSGLGTAVSAIWSGIVGSIKWAINGAIGLIDDFIGGVDSIGIDLGPVHIHPDIPQIPYLAGGTNDFSGGWAVVGENGPELVNLPGRSQVIPNNQIYPIRPSATAVAASVAGNNASSGGVPSGNQTIILEIDGHQLAQVVQKHTDQYVRLKLGPKGRVA